jgi:hypothetical protein
MKHECMLDIQSVMAYVIRNEVVDFLDDARLYINRVKCRLASIGNVHQNTHLKIMPMHTMNFILNLWSVILEEINTREHCVMCKIFQALAKLKIMPSRNIIMKDKFLQMWSKILQQFSRLGFMVFNFLRFFVLPIICLSNHFIVNVFLIN